MLRRWKDERQFYTDKATTPVSPPNPLLLNAYNAPASVKKAPAMWGFGMSKSGTKLLLKISLQVAQVLQQLSGFPASQVP